MQSGDIWKKDLGLGPYISLSYQPHIPYACGMDSAGLRNAFRTHTEFIPPPMRNIWTLYHRIPECVDTPFLLFLKK